MAQVTKTLTIRVTPEFHKKLKIFLAENGLSIQEYVMALIEEDMQNREEGQVKK